MIDDLDIDDDNIINDSFSNQLDNEFKEYISTSFQKDKKAKYTFKHNDTALWKEQKVTIIYGPYINGLRQMYECQLSDGTIQPISACTLKKI